MAEQTGNVPQEPFPSSHLMDLQTAGSPPASEVLRYQADLLEQMHDALFVWQLHGPVVYWNQAAEHLFGHSRQQALGRVSHELLQTQHPFSARYFQDILSRTGQWTGELRYRTADGQQIVVESRMVLLRYPNATEYVLETTRDVTPYKRTEDQLHGAGQALEQRAADLANQLRSLASQLSIAQQQERRHIGQQLQDLLQQLLAGGKLRSAMLSRRAEDDDLCQFLRGIDELLDGSVDPLRSLAAQLVPPILHHGSLCQILQWLARWMQDKHGLTVQINVDEQANPQSEEVRIVLFHVVRELLFNIRRHAGTRQATVTLVPGAEHVQIAVTDDGLGFDPSDLQGRDSTSATGLACIRQRLEQLGGQMEIHSAPGEGTLVILEAPIHLAEGQAQDRSAAPLAAPTVEVSEKSDMAGGVPKIRVLLADDHAVVRDGLRRLLQMQPDIEVVAQAADGMEAVDLALQLRPDVIVLDTNMPRLNGIQAARRILANLPGAKIIGLSMYTAADMDLAMRQAGACEYLTKSSSPDNVVTAVRSCVLGRSDR